MKQDFPQRHEMQMPYGPGIIRNFDDEFEKLSDNYDMHDSDDVKRFMEKHEHILGYIHELTPLINRYFPNHEKFIEFCPDPEFSDLDFVMIYIAAQESDYDSDYELLKKFKNEPLYMSKFSKDIRGLLCVELW